MVMAPLRSFWILLRVLKPERLRFWSQLGPALSVVQWHFVPRIIPEPLQAKGPSAEATATVAETYKISEDANSNRNSRFRVRWDRLLGGG